MLELKFAIYYRAASLSS